jgi:hypothetical protein
MLRGYEEKQSKLQDSFSLFLFADADDAEEPATNSK